MMIEYCTFEPMEPGVVRRLRCPKCGHVTRPTDLPLYMVTKVCQPPAPLPIPWLWRDTFDREVPS